MLLQLLVPRMNGFVLFCIWLAEIAELSWEVCSSPCWTLLYWSQNGRRQMAVVKVATWLPACLFRLWSFQSWTSRSSKDLSAHERAPQHASVSVLQLSATAWCVAYSPSSLLTWKGYFDRSRSKQKMLKFWFDAAYLLFHAAWSPRLQKSEKDGQLISKSFCWHPDVERTSPFGGGHCGCQATKA